MNKVRFLAKITMAASVFACLTFTLSCSDDKEDKVSGKWCVFGSEEDPRCIEMGAKYSDGYTMTEDLCNMQYNSSIKDEKPEDCIVMTD
jgi:hypothetical protein